MGEDLKQFCAENYTTYCQVLANDFLSSFMMAAGSVVYTWEGSVEL